ncbi:MAG: patatin-like phospholipase family protein [Pseudomonadota bacterium]
MAEKPQPPPPVVVEAPKPPPPRIALALGGGAARGFAHIGVLKVLESHGLKVDVIVGTSAGSVVGALSAAGYTGFDLQQQAFDLDRATVADWTLFGKGLIRGDALRQFVNIAVGNRPIERLPKKFACVAANLKTGEAILFERGETGQAVQASSAVPGVFAPTVISGVEYVDGGLVSVVPIRYAKKLGADFIIAVDVAAPPDQREAQGKLDVVMKTFGIMGKTIREAEYPLADVLIVPDMSTVSSSDFEGKHRAILAGERAAQAALPELTRKLLLRGVELGR